jgi:glutaredoxin
VENKRYILYVKASCPFCKLAEDVLIEKEEKYFVVPFDMQPEVLQLLKEAYSYETVPMVFKREGDQINFIGGYTDLVKHLDE